MNSQQMKALMVSLRPQIDAALAAVAKANGLAALNLGNGKFDPVSGEFSWKLEGKVAGAKGKEAVLYEENTWLGLPPLGSSFVNKGREFKTAGLNTTGTKVICDCLADGKQYVFPLEAIKAKFPRTPVTGSLTQVEAPTVS